LGRLASSATIAVSAELAAAMAARSTTSACEEVDRAAETVSSKALGAVVAPLRQGRPMPEMQDAAHWRSKGEELRAFAGGMQDPAAKKTMLDIADSYDRMAGHADAIAEAERALGRSLTFARRSDAKHRLSENELICPTVYSVVL
jgi:hypothetical protein